MPLLAPTDIRPARLIGFNYAKSWNEPKTGVGIHFFLDDYQFERIWNKPEEYTRLLASFDMACAPDWSLYLDMPRPMQQWNVYRSRAIGDWWQRQGLAVVPTLSWSDENSYEYCFNGLPTGSTVAVSTIGVKGDPERERLWHAGMDEAIARVRPNRVLLYGGTLGHDMHGIETIAYANAVTDRMAGDKPP